MVRDYFFLNVDIRPRHGCTDGPGEEGKGSITGIFSVLVDGDDHNDPIADTIRSTLDGHIVLEREIAEQGRFPPVNVLYYARSHAWHT
jgi:flagellum-specific ATP synthase